MQNYSTKSREHYGKKLLVTTKGILHKFRISEACGLQNSKFLIFSSDEIVVDSNGESLGKTNCHLGRIKLSAFLTMFMLNFVTVTLPLLFR